MTREGLRIILNDYLPSEFIGTMAYYNLCHRLEKELKFIK